MASECTPTSTTSCCLCVRKSAIHLFRFHVLTEAVLSCIKHMVGVKMGYHMALYSMFQYVATD